MTFLRYGAIAAALSPALTNCAPVAVDHLPPIARALAAIETDSGGRLGVALVDADGRLLLASRPEERFALCSTFKLLLAGMVLDGDAKGLWSLDDRIAISEADIVYHSPAMRDHVSRGSVSMGDAAKAMVTVGDNAAANLLLRRTGGLQPFNKWLRQGGDTVTRLDRFETALNENAAGDPRDTTTPQAMARSAADLVLGDRLPPARRAALREWLRASETGLSRIRAGLPRGYAAGDKTGTCGAEGRESYNDVAFILPDHGGKSRGYLLAVYLDRPASGANRASAHIADVARVAARTMASE